MTDTQVPILTIDGPSGSGKGTAALAVADAMGWHYLDSVALVAAGRELPVRFQGSEIYYQDQLVGDEIRSEEIAGRASRIAALTEVRQVLLEWQRNCARPPGLVADGRYMGSVVFPSALCKVFLQASPEERANRRYKQLKEKGIDAILSRIVEDIDERDRRDRERASAPLLPAPDAVLIDSSEMSIAEVCTAIVELLRSRISG